MRKFTKAMALALALLVSTSVGFTLGYFRALEEVTYFNGGYKALLSTVSLEYHRDGRTEQDIHLHERDLFDGIVDYGKYLNLRFRVYDYVYPTITNHSQVKRAVKYALEHPYPKWDPTDPNSWKPDADMDNEFIENAITNHDKQNKIYDSVIERFRE